MKNLYDILLQYENIKIIYFSFDKGDVFVVMQEENTIPLPYFEKDDIGYLSSPFIFAQTMKEQSLVYIYVWVFPEYDQDHYNIDDNELIEFKKFIDGIKPQDFKEEN